MPAPADLPDTNTQFSTYDRLFEPNTLTSSANATAPSCQRLINKGAEWTVTNRKLTRELDQQP
jgi:hypothetical protein